MNFCIYNVFERWNPDSKWNYVSVECEYIRWNHLMFSFRQIQTLCKLISKEQQWFFFTAWIHCSVIHNTHTCQECNYLPIYGRFLSLTHSLSPPLSFYFAFSRSVFDGFLNGIFILAICMHKYYFYNL